MRNEIKVFVALLNEGTPTIKGTRAAEVSKGLYEILATPDYDAEDEEWEFPPGSIVKVEERDGYPGKYLRAVSP